MAHAAEELGDLLRRGDPCQQPTSGGALWAAVHHQWLDHLARGGRSLDREDHQHQEQSAQCNQLRCTAVIDHRAKRLRRPAVVAGSEVRPTELELGLVPAVGSLGLLDGSTENPGVALVAAGHVCLVPVVTEHRTVDFDDGRRRAIDQIDFFMETVTEPRRPRQDPAPLESCLVHLGPHSFDQHRAQPDHPAGLERGERVAHQSDLLGGGHQLFVGVDHQHPVGTTHRDRLIARPREVVIPEPEPHHRTSSTRPIHRVIRRPGVVHHHLIDQPRHRRDRPLHTTRLVLHDHERRQQRHLTVMTPHRPHHRSHSLDIHTGDDITHHPRTAHQPRRITNPEHRRQRTRPINPRLVTTTRDRHRERIQLSNRRTRERRPQPAQRPRPHIRRRHHHRGTHITHASSDSRTHRSSQHPHTTRRQRHQPLRIHHHRRTSRQPRPAIDMHHTRLGQPQQPTRPNTRLDTTHHHHTNTGHRIHHRIHRHLRLRCGCPCVQQGSIRSSAAATRRPRLTVVAMVDATSSR